MFVCRLIVFKNFRNAKSAFSTFLFLNQFQLWSYILGGYHWGNLCDMVLEGIWDIFYFNLSAQWPSFQARNLLMQMSLTNYANENPVGALGRGKFKSHEFIRTIFYGSNNFHFSLRVIINSLRTVCMKGVVHCQKWLELSLATFGCLHNGDLGWPGGSRGSDNTPQIHFALVFAWFQQFIFLSVEISP